MTVGAGGGNTATFAINLEADVAGPSELSADALEQFRQKIIEDTSELGALQKQMRAMQGASSVNVAAFKQLRDSIDAKKQALGDANAKMVLMGGSMRKAATDAQATGGAMGELAGGLHGAGDGAGGLLGAMRELPGPLGRTAREGSRVLGAIGPLGVLAIAAVAGVVLLTAAVVKLGVELLTFGLRAAGARRDMLLLGEAATGSAAGARNLEGSVKAVSRDVATSRADLGKMPLELQRAGLSGRVLEDTMHMTAIAASTMGDAAGAKLKDIAVEAQKTGRFMLTALDLKGTGVAIADVANALARNLKISFAQAQAILASGSVKLADGVRAMNDAVGNKFGGVAKAQMLSFDNQITRAKEDLSNLFKNVHVEKFLEALHKLLGLLDESTATGRALQKVMTVMLNPLIDALASPKAAKFFKLMVIGVLEVTVAILKLAREVDKLIQKLGGLKNIGDGLGTGKGFGGVKPGTKGDWTGIDFGHAANDNSKKAQPAGAAFSAGLAAGIKSGSGAVIAEVLALSAEAEGAFTSHFGIHSPSKLMHDHGAQLPAGAAEGVEDGSDRLQRATDQMLATPGKGAAGGRGRATGGGMQVGEMHLHFHGDSAKHVSDPSRRAQFMRDFTEMVETVAQSSGKKAA